MDDSPSAHGSSAPQTGSSTAPRAPSPWKRILWIGLPLVVALGLGLYFWWPSLQLSILINGLNSDEPTVVREMIDRLSEHPDIDAVNERLQQALHDDGRSFEVRLTCAKLLLRRNRRTQLEDALKNGKPRAQEIALKALSTQPTFVNYYVKDTRWKVQDVLSTWLARGGDLSRVHAIGLARKIDFSDAMPAIRPLLKPSNDPAVDGRLEGRVIESAIEAVRQFGDCESVPQLMVLAEAAPNDIVQMRALQSLFRMSTMDKTCGEQIDIAAVRALNTKALTSNKRVLRLAALLHYRQMVEWVNEDSQAIRSIVTDPSRDSEERRHALEALAGSGDPDFLDELPTYFFDRESTVRSSASQTAHQYRAQNRYQGCWIAMLRNERETEVGFREALRGLQQSAKSLKGFDNETMKLASKDPRKLDEIILELFEKGNFGNMSRLSVANAWFDWWTEELGLGSEGAAAIAQSAHRAFWKAADANNATEAHAALEDARKQLGDVPEYLFAAEEAWLRVRAKP